MIRNALTILLSLFLPLSLIGESLDRSDKIEDQCQTALQFVNSEQYEEAIPVLEGIIEFLKLGFAKPDEIATWYKLLGTCYLEEGLYDNAEQSYIQGYELLISSQYGNSLIFRQLLDALTVLYAQIQQYDKAQQCSNRAKSLYEINNDFGNDYVRCLSNAAMIQSSLGYNAVARMYVDFALRQAKENISWDSMDDETFWIRQGLPYVTLLNNASQIYLGLGYFNEAAKAVKEAIKVSEELHYFEPLPYNNLGILYLYKSKYNEATRWFSRAFSYCKTPYEVDEVGMNTALSLFLSKDCNAPLFSANLSSRMRENISSSFAFLNANERYNYWKHFESFLPMLNLILFEGAQKEYFGCIYDNVLQTKGLLLRSTNQIRDAVSNSNDEETLSAYAKLTLLKKQGRVERDSVRTDSILKEIDKLDKWLTRKVSTYASFIKNNDINWKSVRDNLKDSDAAIEFYNIPLVWGLDSIQKMNGEPRYCALIVKKDYEYPHIIPLCKESDLQEIEAENFYSTEITYNLIWKPLEEELRGISNIYFAADRELHKIGIEYAMFPDNSFIFNHHNLFRLSSTRELAEVRRPILKEDQAVLFGGLQYDIEKEDYMAECHVLEGIPSAKSRSPFLGTMRYGVKYLPGTKNEVEAIANNFADVKDRPYRIITGVKGTEESFKRLEGQHIGIIHLATHGFFWSNDKAKEHAYVNFLTNASKVNQTFEDKALLRSGLFFSGANIGLKGESLPDDVEDGVLTAQELSVMNLGYVDMVVMSACESGLGETSGEGVFGLQRGFKLAGAQSLLMSLWKVDDEATKALMTEFYRHLLDGNSKVESLRLAQKHVKLQPGWEAPKYWAGFILLDALD